MKPFHISKSFIRISLLSFFLVFLAQVRMNAQCLSVDLQAVSIDPSTPSVTVGGTIQLVVVMRNNGPCPIPIGEAQVQISFSSVYLDPGTPLNFVDQCAPGRWSYLTNVPTPGLHNLFFRNDAGAIPVGGVFCAFQFDIKGKAGAPGPVSVTLASTLTASATTADQDGSNQSASTFVDIVGAPDLTSSQLFTTTQVVAGGVIDEVIVIRNVGSGPTTAPIVFNITNYTPLSGLTVTSNGSPSVTIGPDTYTLDNANWTYSNGQFTSNAGVVIPAGGSRNLGIRITRGTGGSAGANGTVTQTTTIVSGTGGGETPITNNSISNTLLKL